jgi:hypothetical protein
MANKLLELLTKLSTGRLVILFILLMLVVNAVVLPAIYPSFGTLDVQSSYSPEKAYQLMESYGEEGRQYYLLIELTLDALYPILSALFFSTLTIYLFHRVFALESFWQKLPLLGPIVMVVDYLENMSVVALLLNYPTRLDLLAQAANVFTITKFALSGLEMILILVGVVGWLGKTIYTSARKSTVH